MVAARKAVIAVATILVVAVVLLVLKVNNQEDVSAAESIEYLAEQGFIFDVDKLEQNHIERKDDSFPYYVILDKQAPPFLPKTLFDYAIGKESRSEADIEFKRYEPILPYIWQVTDYPRYKVPGDWSNFATLRIPHTVIISRVAQVHRILAIMAAEDGDKDKVKASLEALLVLIQHGKDQLGGLGALKADSVEALLCSATSHIASMHSEDQEMLQMLRVYLDQVSECTDQYSIKAGFPLYLSILEGVESGRIPLDDIGGEFPIKSSSMIKKNMPVVKKRFLDYIASISQAWDDHAKVESLTDDFFAEFDRKGLDVNRNFQNEVLYLTSIYGANWHDSEQRAKAMARTSKVFLAALDLRLESESWPTLDEAAAEANTSHKDPFGDDLHYIVDSNSLTIYSNGQDRVDDGGKHRVGSSYSFDYPIYEITVSAN